MYANLKAVAKLHIWWRDDGSKKKTRTPYSNFTRNLHGGSFDGGSALCSGAGGPHGPASILGSIFEFVQALLLAAVVYVVCGDISLRMTWFTIDNGAVALVWLPSFALSLLLASRFRLGLLLGVGIGAAVIAFFYGPNTISGDWRYSTVCGIVASLQSLLACYGLKASRSYVRKRESVVLAYVILVVVFGLLAILSGFLAVQSSYIFGLRTDLNKFGGLVSGFSVGDWLCLMLAAIAYHQLPCKWEFAVLLELRLERLLRSEEAKTHLEDLFRKGRFENDSFLKIVTDLLCTFLDYKIAELELCQYPTIGKTLRALFSEMSFVTARLQCMPNRKCRVQSCHKHELGRSSKISTELVVAMIVLQIAFALAIASYVQP